MKKHLLLAASLSLAAIVSLTVMLPNARAQEKATGEKVKVDCEKVMSILNTGKAPNAAAAELKLQMIDVLRCRRKAQKEAYIAEQKAKARKLLGITPNAAASPASK